MTPMDTFIHSYGLTRKSSILHTVDDLVNFTVFVSFCRQDVVVGTIKYPVSSTTASQEVLTREKQRRTDTFWPSSSL